MERRRLAYCFLHPRRKPLSEVDLRVVSVIDWTVFGGTPKTARETRALQIQKTGRTLASRPVVGLKGVLCSKELQAFAHDVFH
ncbi:hypothetical protein SAMN02745166_01970 [Prosthecobacter debontii]|uniref:Uncharacterized protein n=1 Tax=Prosthecobacter debontii TaxID=48467 RepID=A0A1T4XTF1_9BACT|nr:hypothetical protein SAMN02745166_01970 [Prosthecobacter debontii]